ncbi:copia protein [Lasius niger]|uniref:Copia protein n=1 Tax=Lasius niger TaxID=67767 RepID=A0A0J7KCC4_LASNI|nr:copia protein [Lasius niger]
MVVTAPENRNATTEAEYVAASSAAKEAVWLRNLLDEIGYRCDSTTVLYVDNQSAIKIAKNPEFHERIKHIDVRYHHIREIVENAVIQVLYVPSEMQKADIFTKALPKESFRRLRESMGMCANDNKHLNGGSVEAV